MRVALVNPRSAGSNRHPRLARLLRGKLARLVRFVEDDVELVPPLSLLQVAGSLPPEWDLTLLDEESGGAVDARLDDPWDMALFTVMVSQAPRAVELSARLRGRGVRTVAGGFHPSADPEGCLPHFDHVVAGEGEEPLGRLLADLARGGAARLYAASGNFPPDLIPPPRYGLIERPRDYTMFPLLFGRGCPNDCSFCSVVSLYGHRLRTRPVAHVLSDIAAIRRLARNPYLSFADENLLADRAAARDLLAALIPERVSFECHTDLSVGADPELLSLLARAGCTRIQVGFESIEPGSLAEVGRFKAAQGPAFRARLDAIQGAGIRVMAMFIIGFDHDTEASLARFSDYLAAADFHQADISVLTPIPGTRVYERLKAEGRLLFDGDWSRHTWQHAVFRPRHFTPRRLEAWADALLARFYLPENARRRRARFKELARGKTARPA